MKEAPYLIQGDHYEDERGKLSFINQFDLKGFRRFYVVTHPDSRVVRAWQGHKQETKCFICLSGAFEIRVVEVNDWDNPPADLKVLEYHLDERDMKALVIPGGFANGFKARNPDSRLLVFSDKTLEESKLDNYRFDKNLWYNWNLI